jgi:hypothetical protein
MAEAQTRERDYRSRGEVPQEPQTGFPSFEIRPGPKLFENRFDHFAAVLQSGLANRPEGDPGSEFGWGVGCGS